MAIILQGKINDTTCQASEDQWLSCSYAGYALFWTGVSVGFSNLFCGYLVVELEYVLAFQGRAAPSPMPRTRTLLSKYWSSRSSVARWDCSELSSASSSAERGLFPKIEMRKVITHQIYLKYKQYRVINEQSLNSSHSQPSEMVNQIYHLYKDQQSRGEKRSLQQ